MKGTVVSFAAQCAQVTDLIQKHCTWVCKCHDMEVDSAELVVDCIPGNQYHWGTTAGTSSASEN